LSGQGNFFVGSGKYFLSGQGNSAREYFGFIIW
jgi:hypothetical protein